jgi:hypothetical protein
LCQRQVRELRDEPDAILLERHALAAENQDEAQYRGQGERELEDGALDREGSIFR